jgi:hypothetical protein
MRAASKHQARQPSNPSNDGRTPEANSVLLTSSHLTSASDSRRPPAPRRRNKMIRNDLFSRGDEVISDGRIDEARVQSSCLDCLNYGG